jgi:uncharacterized protein involved in exopolysaccharide biosynthesis
VEHDESASEPERLTLAQIFGLIIHGWRVIVTVTAVCVLIAAVAGLTGGRLYRTYYVVMPAPTNSDPTRPTGLSLDVLGRQSRTPEWEMYLSLLNSTTLADRLVKRTDILQRLYGGSWNASRKQWNTQLDFWSLPLKGKIKWIFGTRTTKAPDKFALQDYLNAHLSVAPVPDTSQIRVSIDSPDPQVSFLLLNYLHVAANDAVRESRLTRAIGQRDHLLSELKDTTVADYRETLLDILGRVETSVMTASIGGQYAAMLVDGPVTLPYPVYPRPFLFIQLSIVAGVILGLVLVIFFPVNDMKLLAAWQKLKDWRR